MSCTRLASSDLVERQEVPHGTVARRHGAAGLEGVDHQDGAAGFDQARHFGRPARGFGAIGIDHQHGRVGTFHPDTGDAIAYAGAAQQDAPAIHLAEHFGRPVGGQGVSQALARVPGLLLRQADPLIEELLVGEGVGGQCAVEQRQHVRNLCGAEGLLFEFGGVLLAQHVLAEESVHGFAVRLVVVVGGVEQKGFHVARPCRRDRRWRGRRGTPL